MSLMLRYHLNAVVGLMRSWTGGGLGASTNRARILPDDGSPT